MEIGNQNRHMLMILLIVFLAFMSSMISVAISQETSYSIAETQITTNGKAILPDIYADKIAYIVYHDNGYLGDIYMYDLSTQTETQVATGTGSSVDICGGKIVWTFDNNGERNIYMYDFSTSQVTQITNDGKSCYPRIYGNIIVYEVEYQSTSTYSDIYMYDISTSQKTQLTSGTVAISPHIYGDKIVWCQNYDIYMYDVSTSQKIQITSGGMVSGIDIYGDKIVWTGGQNIIHLYDLSTSDDVIITSTNYSNVPVIYKDRVVWSDFHDSHGSDDIFMYNISTGQKTQITTSGHSRDPNIFGNRIVYRNYGGTVGFGTDIYMSTLTSQESTGPSLVQVQGSSDVYLIENGMKRHFTSSEALEWNGYSFNDVIEISSETLASIPAGADISITQAIIDKYHALGGSPIFGPAVGTGELNGEPDSAGNYCSYVNFQNGAIYCFQNGPHLGEAYAIFDPLFTKWGQLGYGAGILGYPIEDMSEPQDAKYTTFRCQNFSNGDQRGALEYDINSGKVVEIHGAIFAKWAETGFASGVLGLVTEDENTAAVSPFKTVGRYSKFENGTIHWISNKVGENEGHLYRGESFVTSGDLDYFYTSMGGTGGYLGFPIMDQRTVDGHGHCKFEGGEIKWDSWTDTYKVKSPEINNPPLIKSVTVQFPESANPGISWVYGDFDGDIQTQMKVEFRTETNGAGREVWSYFMPSQYPSVTYNGEESLVAGQTYYVRVQIFDGTVWSDWCETSFVSQNVAERDIKVSLVTVRDAGEVGFIQLGDTVDVTVAYQNLANPLESEDFTLYISGLHSGSKILSYDIPVTITAGRGVSGETKVPIELPASNIYLTLDSIQVELVPINFVDADGSNNHGVSAYFLTAMTDKSLYDNLISLVLQGLGKIGKSIDKVDTILKADPELSQYRDDLLYTENTKLQEAIIELKICARVIKIAASFIDPAEAVHFVANIWIEVAKGVLDLGFSLAQTANLLNFIVHEAADQGAKLDIKALYLDCPVDIQITVANGNVIRSENGQVIGSIPDVYMVVVGDEKRVLMFNDTYDSCQIQLTGTDTGTFNFSVYNANGANETTYQAFNNVPVNAGTVCYIQSTSDGNLPMSIDTNGDGTIERIIGPSIVSLGGSPILPVSISNIQSTKGTTWINWTWINPDSPNFNHTEIYLDDVFQTNISSEYLNFTGLQPSTNYTISTRTVDIYGNVNQTWVNLTETTLPLVHFTANSTSGAEPLNVKLSDHSTDAALWEWDFGDGTPVAHEQNPLHIYADNGEYTVTLTVTDDDGGVGTDTLTMTVNNVNPVIDAIAVPIDPYKVNTPVSVSSSFADAGIVDTHTAVWDWGDGTNSAGVVTETNDAGTVTGEHTYTKAGIYRLAITVTDDDGGIASETSESYVVVYDSTGGFVTGGGWINSPAGAYVPDTTLSGKATFEFVSMYTKKATKPTGITMFQLKMSKSGNGKSTKTTNLNFKSTSYDWLVVSGNQAKCKGTGTINGKGNYGFMISIVDGKNKKNDIDKLRIKIWDKASGAIFYDNQMDAPEDAEPTTTIGGGAIVIHKEK